MDPPRLGGVPDRPLVLPGERRATVQQGHVDAVGAHPRAQEVQTGAPGGVGPVEQHRAGAPGEQVPGGDGVDPAQPLVGVAQVRRAGAPGPAPDGRQPAGQAPGVHVGADVRAGVQDDVQTALGGRAQEQVEVADTGEVVRAGGGECWFQARRTSTALWP